MGAIAGLLVLEEVRERFLGRIARGGGDMDSAVERLLAWEPIVAGTLVMVLVGKVKLGGRLKRGAVDTVDGE